MTQLNVNLFASLKEQLGQDQLTIEWPDQGTVTELIDQIGSMLGDDAKQLLAQDEILVAVNQTIVEKDHTISHRDEVAFLPPVTGG